MTVPVRAMASVDGVLGPLEAARVPLTDRGLTLGDATFATLRARGLAAGAGDADGIQRLDAHLARLARAAARLRLAFDRDALVRELARVRAAVGAEDAALRVTLSRAAPSPSSVSSPSPSAAPSAALRAGALLRPPPGAGTRVVVVGRPHVPPPPEAYAVGVDVARARVPFVAGSALDPAIKAPFYLAAILALLDADAAAKHAPASPAVAEVLFATPDDALVCAGAANVLLVRGGALVTPHLASGCRDGTTREAALAAARALGVPVEERAVPFAEVLTADEAWLASSGVGLLPIARVDGVPAGGPGPVGRRLAASLG